MERLGGNDWGEMAPEVCRGELTLPEQVLGAKKKASRVRFVYVHEPPTKMHLILVENCKNTSLWLLHV